MSTVYSGMFGPSEYAWLITKDFITEPNEEGYAVGQRGPSDAPPELLSQLETGHGHIFYLYDDDGIRYYQGLAAGDMDGDEGACYGPLGDFGAAWGGCTTVKFRGHPEWDCG